MEVEWKYSSTLSLTSALDGGWVVKATNSRFTPRNDPVPSVKEAGCASEPVWTGAEKLAPTGTWSPDRPARTESLYGLSHPGTFCLFLISSIRKSRCSPSNLIVSYQLQKLWCVWTLCADGFESRSRLEVVERGLGLFQGNILAPEIISSTYESSSPLSKQLLLCIQE